MRFNSIIVTAFILLTVIHRIAAAKNVDLSTVPKRNGVQLTIYNSEDLTLVRETRTITFKKGVNPLQYSWANTLIDPSSVHIAFLTNPEKLDLLDTTFPHDKPQMLYWNIQSDFDGEASVEITYFTSGITWSADYLCVADKAEKTAAVEGFVRVTNNSGEEYEDAHVRLVVGKINLVEKMAELAQVPINAVPGLKAEHRAALRKLALKDAIEERELVDRDADMPADDPAKPKAIAKEGLSDYFIFSIEGTETIPNGWTKRMRSLDAAEVPFTIQYRYRPLEYGENLVRMYLLKNDKDSKLGTSPLPDGAVRLFRDNGRGGLSYLAAQNIKYIPIGDKIELNLGRDPNVQFELVKLRTSRDEIWMRGNGVNIFRKVGQGGIVLEANTTVAGWDDHAVYAQRVRNYTDKPISVEVRRSFGGHVVFRSGLTPTLFDFQTIDFTAAVDAGKKADMRFEIVQHEGISAKQNNVTLEKAEIAL